MGSVKPSHTMLQRAKRIGRRAGVVTRGSGIPEPCPFDKSSMPELYGAWSEGYVSTAHRKD